MLFSRRIEGQSALQHASDDRQSRIVAQGRLDTLKRLKEISPSLAMGILCLNGVIEKDRRGHRL